MPHFESAADARLGEGRGCGRRCACMVGPAGELLLGPTKPEDPRRQGRGRKTTRLR